MKWNQIGGPSFYPHIHTWLCAFSLQPEKKAQINIYFQRKIIIIECIPGSAEQTNNRATGEKRDGKGQEII